MTPRRYASSEDFPRLRALGDLLRSARRRIPAGCASLGNVLRLPRCVGRRVNQEEAADALGISRVWYSLLERGQLGRPPVPLLERAAQVLMLDQRERVELLRLGIPEMSSALLASRHGAIIDASSTLRRTMNRLWTASSVVEALQIAAEESTEHFDDACLVFFVQRVAPGRWAHPFIVDRGIGATTEEMYQEIALSLTPEGFDEFVLYQLLTAPGDVGTRESFNLTCVADVYEAALQKYRLGRAHFIHSRIRSRDGLVAGITVKHEREHAYTEVERATISAIASVASLALS